MQVCLRLYPQYDNDLIALRNYYGKSFPGIIRQCLAGCVSGTPCVIEVPEYIKEYISMEEKPVRVGVLFLKSDYEIENLMLSFAVKKGRSNLVKHLLRSCYSRFPFELFQTATLENYGGSLSGTPAKAGRKAAATIIRKESTLAQNAASPKDGTQVHQPQRVPEAAIPKEKAFPSNENIHTPPEHIRKEEPSSKPDAFPEDNGFDMFDILDQMIQSR